MLLLDGLKAKGYAIYMRPPNCYLCERGLDTEDECELISFTKIPENVIKSVRGSIYPVPTHPDSTEWFCKEEHFNLAKQFKHLTYEEAVNQLKCITGKSREDSNNIKLDYLFVSECTLCGDVAGWTGVIEEESFEESIELGTLMYCYTCANSFLTVSGALQEYLKKSPPIFIPGRRLSDTEEPE